jgi:hypothetical protein
VAEHQTCGQGLAEHSTIPRMLGELTDALAENLEVHLRALDATDDVGRAERNAYVSLAAQHRQIAAQLHEVGEEMAGYRDLPMARHDERALAAPDAIEAFTRFVAAERQLHGAVEQSLERDEAMLRQARG